MEASAQEVARHQEIRRFLMARRAAISPESAGLPGGSRRRTPGLRREEVASLAGVGVTWYTWFEQGRDIRVSVDTLRRIARALRLTPSDEAYLFSLAQMPDDPGSTQANKPGREYRAIVDGFTTGPAVVLDPVWNVVAYNRLADLIFHFDAMTGPFAKNHLWRVFMDPARRDLYVDYEKAAELSAGVLRQSHARLIEDPYLDSLIRDLRGGSEAFRRYWETQVTTLIDTVDMPLRLPVHGVVHFTSIRLRPAGAESWLVGFLAPADEHAARVMRELSGDSGPRPAANQRRAADLAAD